MARLARLDVNSKFQIDLEWWARAGRDFRVEVLEALCDECRAEYASEQVRLVDRVDPETGEVSRIDIAWDCLVDVCSTKPKFINPAMPMTRLIFRAFLASGNRPLSATEVHQRIRKGNAEAVLKELLHRSADEYGIVPVGL